jgi:hypothetical protein
VIVVKRKRLSPGATAGIGIGVTLLIAAVGWFLLISPQRSRASEIDEEIGALEVQIAQARLAAEQAENAQPVRTADLFRLTKAMPSDNDIAGVLLELSETAGDAGIVFEQIIPGTTVAAGTFRAQPIELVFTGNFYSLSDFLYRLRNLVSVQQGELLANGRLFSVDKLQFVEADSKFPNIRALLTVSALLYGTSGEPPPSPPQTTSEATTTETATTETPDETAPPVDDATAAGAP